MGFTHLDARVALVGFTHLDAKTGQCPNSCRPLHILAVQFFEVYDAAICLADMFGATVFDFWRTHSADIQAWQHLVCAGFFREKVE